MLVLTKGAFTENNIKLRMLCVDGLYNIGISNYTSILNLLLEDNETIRIFNESKFDNLFDINNLLNYIKTQYINIETKDIKILTLIKLIQTIIKKHYDSNLNIIKEDDDFITINNNELINNLVYKKNLNNNQKIKKFKLSNKTIYKLNEIVDKLKSYF